MTDYIEKAWEKDIDVRTNGLEQANRTGYKVHVHEIAPGDIYKDKNVTVNAFAVAHGPGTKLSVTGLKQLITQSSFRATQPPPRRREGVQPVRHSSA